MEDFTFIIADANDLCRYGFSSIIRDHFQTSKIEVAHNKYDLRKLLANQDRSMVIIDFASMDFDNMEDVHILSMAFKYSRWLFAAFQINESFVLPLTTSFSSANFICKTNDYDIIVAAITATISGKKYYCSEALHLLMQEHGRKKEYSNSRSLLTTTELQLVQLLAQGKTTREIAEERCLSYHTVNTHRKNIFRKLEINSVQELIKYALKNGLVDLTEYYI